MGYKSIKKDIQSKFSITFAILVFYIVVIGLYYDFEISKISEEKNISLNNTASDRNETFLQDLTTEKQDAMLLSGFLIIVYLVAYVIFDIVKNHKLFGESKCPKAIDVLLSSNLVLIVFLLFFMIINHRITENWFYELVKCARNEVLTISIKVIPFLLLFLLVLPFICNFFCKRDC